MSAPDVSFAALDPDPADAASGSLRRQLGVRSFQG